MTVSDQARWWGAGLVLLVAALWLLADILLPFLLGMAIAYFTDPVADRLETMGLSRTMAVVVITLVTIGVVVLGVLLVLPVLIQQIQGAVAAAPDSIADARELIREWLPTIGTDSGFVGDAFQSVRQRVQEAAGTIVQRVVSGGLSILNAILILFVTPVVAFYLLLDWDNMIAKIDDWLPREHLETIRRLAREVDDVLSGFVRGQTWVCLILGAFYALALTVVGLNFGLLIGAFAGLITFIPYVGSVVGGILSVGVALVQFWNEPVWIAVVAGIFAAGQAVEGNFLTPKLVGGSVGLHPVWLMFALAAFGALFGFVGLLVAVPAAAIIGVLGRFLIQRYKEGPLYKGTGRWRHDKIEARARLSEAPGDPET